MAGPWFKFYPADWRSDPRLRLCSLAARGLWMELIAVAHEAEPYGHVLVEGIAPTESDLCRLAGGTNREVQAALGELEARGVFSKTDTGVIYSRRMVRDKAKEAKDRENGRDGGNPKITGRVNGGVNPQPNPPVGTGDKAQKPEARLQTENPQSPTGSSPPAGKPAEKTRKGTKLPEGWEPSAADRAYAVDRNFSLTEIVGMAEDFRGYFTEGKGRNQTHANWPGRWQTWVRKEHPKSKGPSNEQPGRTGRFRSATKLLRGGPGLGPVGADGHGADPGLPGREVDGRGGYGPNGDVLRTAGPELAGRWVDPTRIGEGQHRVEVLSDDRGNSVRVGAAIGARVAGPTAISSATALRATGAGASSGSGAADGEATGGDRSLQSALGQPGARGEETTSSTSAHGGSEATGPGETHSRSLTGMAGTDGAADALDAYERGNLQKMQTGSDALDIPQSIIDFRKRA